MKYTLYIVLVMTMTTSVTASESPSTTDSVDDLVGLAEAATVKAAQDAPEDNNEQETPSVASIVEYILSGFKSPEEN